MGRSKEIWVGHNEKLTARKLPKLKQTNKQILSLLKAELELGGGVSEFPGIVSWRITFISLN